MIRNADSADLIPLADLIHRAWKTDLMDLLGESDREVVNEDWFKRLLKQDISCQNRLALVAIENEVIQGYACGRMREDDNLRAEVFGLYVDPMYQGRGVGSKLMATLHQHFAQLGYQESVICTFRGASNNAFYQQKAPVTHFNRDIVINGSTYSGIGYVYSLLT